MKILHVAETVKGGVATVMSRLITGNVHISDEVVCIVPSNQIDQLDIPPGCCVRPFKAAGRGWAELFRLTRSLVEVVWFEKPNVVHLHSTFAGMIGRLVLALLWPVRRPKVVYTPHGFAFLTDASARQKSAVAFAERLAAFFCYKVICVSEYEYREARQRRITANRLVTIRNGVSRPAPDSRSSEHRLRMTDRLFVLFVGRLDRQKGFDRVLDAAVQCPPELVEFHVAGTPVRGDAMPCDFGKVFYHGWLSFRELEKLYLKADVVLMPSRWEGLPMAALEAMSYGLPIVASDCGCFLDLIRNGFNGFLCDADDTAGISRLLLSTPRRQWSIMGRNAAQLVWREYTEERMVNQTLALYKSAMLNTRMRHSLGR